MCYCYSSWKTRKKIVLMYVFCTNSEIEWNLKTLELYLFYVTLMIHMHNCWTMHLHSHSVALRSSNTWEPMRYLYFQWCTAWTSKHIPESFLSTLQNKGVEFLHGVENFHQGEVLFVQVAYNFLHAEKCILCSFSWNCF